MFANVLIVFALSALAANAQSSSEATSDSASVPESGPTSVTGTDSAAVPTSTASVPPCVLNCTTTAATAAGCSGVTDISCVCTNPGFQSAAQACLASCSPADQQAALGLQSALCAGASASGSASGSDSASPETSESVPSGSATRPGTTTPTSSVAPIASGSIGSPTNTGSASNGSTSGSPTNAAGTLQPFGFRSAHAVGAAGVGLFVVAGAVALF